MVITQYNIQHALVSIRQLANFTRFFHVMSFQPVKALHGAETRYSQPEKEIYAVIEGLRNYEPYMWGAHFTLLTDAKALTWLKTANDTKSKLARWAIEL